MRTVDGIIYETFKDAAIARGLLENDEEWYKCLEEAAIRQMPSQLRNLFCTICVFCSPTDPIALFFKYRFYFIEDFLNQNNSLETAYNNCLIEFQKFFKLHNLTCEHFGFVNPIYHSVSIETPIDLVEEASKANEMKSKLNNDQSNIVNKIIDSLQNTSPVSKAFFIDGPGGTGKTFLYKTLTHILRSQRKKVISVAWTGIASLLLIDGRTVHNIFQIPLELNEESTSKVPLNSDKAHMLAECDVFIWDEAPMAPIHALNAIDKLLRTLMQNELPFGGKVFILGGDFRQVTPVLPKANKAKIIEFSIKNKIRTDFEVLKLKTNMRSDPDEKIFANYLIDIGNGNEKTYNELGEDLIKIPEQCVVKGDIISDLYGDITDLNQLKDICCLSTKNEFVHELNERIQNEIIPGELHTKIRFIHL